MSTRTAVLVSPVLFVAATVVFALVLSPACTGPGAPARDGTRLDDSHTIGEPVVVGNLTVWPVFTNHPVDLGEFATLAEALEKGVAEVREAGGGQQVSEIEDFDVELATEPFIADPIVDGSGGASVGTLVIENRGDVPLLVCAGTIVKGGNQDRQIGEDVIVQAGATVPVQAFCVEKGRWTALRMGVVTDGKFVVAKANATKDVRENAQYLKKQEGVWNEVAEAKTRWRDAFSDVEFAALPQAANARAVESSSSLAVVLDANDEVAGKELKALRDAVRVHFAKHGTDAVGFAYAVDGRVVSVRAFLNRDVFRRQFDPFLESMVAEAWLARRANPDAPAVAGKTEDVVALVADIEQAGEVTTRTRGANLNGIRMNDHGYNGNCYLPVEGRKVAVTRDWSSK